MSIKLLTKLTYLFVLVAITVFPLVVWARDPAAINLAAVGAFAAGLGVPMGTLTAAMAAAGIARRKSETTSVSPPGNETQTGMANQ